MTIAAFDAKQYTRMRSIPVQIGKKHTKKDVAFQTQLGAGVIISKPEEFAKQYVKANTELQDSFGLDYNLPFFSSSQLKKALGFEKAISFADQIIQSVQERIDSIHCSYAILSPSKKPTVEVGGQDSPKVSIPTGKFIDNLGPMFSYLAAHSYLWKIGYSNVADTELHIDAFRSKHTKAWDMITEKTSPKVFMRGDECNPFISCADFMAFLTDAKLYGKNLKLEPGVIKTVWEKYAFDVTVQFFDWNSLPYYAWKNNDTIDFSRYLARPILFLAVDEIESNKYAETLEDVDHIDADLYKPMTFSRVIKESVVYYAALRYASKCGGCVKIYSRAEDMKLIRDGDIFVYVGVNSKAIGASLQDGYDIKVFSGLEMRKMTEK